MTEDLISRQTAIDVLEERVYANRCSTAVVSELNRSIGYILRLPTVDAVEIKKDGEWEMFDLISSAYYGKEMYFKEDNLTVYSRYSHHYMSVDDAIREFISLIG